MRVKRPLCLAAVMTAAVVALWMHYRPPSETAFLEESKRELTEGEAVVADGIIDRYEYRENTRAGTAENVISKEIWIYLKKVRIKEETYSDSLICRMDVTGKEKPKGLKAGSLVQIKGNFSYFSQADNPGEFDTKKYYKMLGIGGMVKQAQIVAASLEYSYWKETLLILRERLKENLYQALPKKEASVLAAMLLGEKAGVDSDTKALYQKNGISHILSISGLHISILGILFYKLLRKLGCPMPVAALTGAFLLVSYGTMTGMGISTIRAVGMYLIRLLGECLGRSYDMLTALSLMGILMLIRHPNYLYNSGFLLSFGAVMGIGIILPVLSDNGNVEMERAKRKKSKRKKSKRKKSKRKKSLYQKGKEGFLAGMAILAAILPVQLFYYYELPLYAQLLNLFVIPLMSLVMGIGLFILLFPGIPFLGTAESLLVGSYELLCNIAECLPGQRLITGRPALWQIVGYYLLLLICFFLKQASKREGEPEGKEGPERNEGFPERNEGLERKGGLKGKKGLERKEGPEGKEGPERKEGLERKAQWRKKYLKSILAGIAAIGAIFLLFGKFPKDTVITFLDVGQGDCIVVSTKAGEHYLFDCGSTTKNQVGSKILIPYLKYSGISRLNGVVISHPDKDHISGILELLDEGKEEGIKIDCVVLPGISKERREEELGEILNKAEEVPVKYLAKGDSFQSGKVEITCLHPQKESRLKDSNAYSACFLVREGEFSMLLTGDVEGEGEEELKKELDNREISRLSVLKTAHHGSRFSTTEAFLEGIRPGIAVISCGRENSYGHPAPETLKRLTDRGWQLINTMDGGAITMTTDGRHLWVKTFKGVSLKPSQAGK